MPNLYDSIAGVGSPAAWTALARGRITTNLTLYVSTSGSDSTGDGSAGRPMATVNGAMSLLKNAVIARDVSVNILVLAGNYTGQSTIYLNHPYGHRIIVLGEYVTKSINATITRSGSAGNWTLTVPCGDTSGMSAGQYVIINAGTGGTAWYNILGCHYVASVTTNTNFTLTSTNYDAPNSVNFTGTVYVLQTVLNFASSQHGFLANGADMGLAVSAYAQKLMLVGNMTSGYYGAFAGGGNVLKAYLVGINYFENGFGTNYASLDLSGCASRQCAYGVLTQWGTAFVNYCAMAGTQSGIASQYGSTIYSPFSIGIQSGASKVGTGFTAAYGAHHTVSQGTALNNAVGFYATSGAHMTAWSCAAYSCTTNYSPTGNTEGNENSFMKTS